MAVTVTYHDEAADPLGKKSIVFTVYGNQENPQGNPIPYFRTTQAARFSKGAMRYANWKTLVVATYLDTALPMKGAPARKDLGDIHDLLERKPIKKKVHARVIATCFFGKENHADPDNIVKGINDALFQDDKHVNVTTHHSCGNKVPRVQVVIHFK